MRKILAIIISVSMLLAGIPVYAETDATDIPWDNAVTISENSTINSSLDEENTERYYRMILPSSGTLLLTFNIDSAELDPTDYMIEVLDEGGTSLGLGYAGDEGYVWALAKGTYYIAISALPDLTETISYSIESEFISSNETTGFGDVTDDTLDEARVISPDTNYVGFIGDNDDIDYYKVDIAQSSKVTASILNGDMKKLNVMLLEVQDDSINCYLDFTASGIEVPPGCQGSASTYLLRGTYYICVKGSSGTGDYEFAVNCQSSNETFPESIANMNNTFQTANDITDKIGITSPSTGGDTNGGDANSGEVTASETIRGQLADNDPIDCYKFTLSESGCIEVKLQADIPLYLCIYNNGLDPSSGKIWYIKAGNAIPPLYLTAGTYYIHVSNSTGFADQDNVQPGNYSFAFDYAATGETFPEVNLGSNNTIEDADEIAAGQLIVAQISENDINDYFKFIVPEDNDVIFQLNSVMENVNLYIYDQNHNKILDKIIESDSRGISDTIEISLEKGTYYIHLKYKNFAGKYTLRYDLKTHYHSLIEVPEQPATQNSDGFRHYYECSCGSLFSDENAANEIDTPEIIPRIANVNLSNPEVIYNGRVRSSSVIVKDRTGKTLDSSAYDVVAPSGRINVGKYSYVVKFRGEYSGSKSLTLSINPKGTTQYSPKARSKAMTVRWKTQTQKMATSRITGYQIRYSTSSSMAGAKYVNVKGYKYSSKKISKLKARKRYYVQVRTYKTVGGKNCYSGWSAKKSVVTK